MKQSWNYNKKYIRLNFCEKMKQNARVSDKFAYFLTKYKFLAFLKIWGEKIFKNQCELVALNNKLLLGYSYKKKLFNN